MPFPKKYGTINLWITFNSAKEMSVMGKHDMINKGNNMFEGDNQPRTGAEDYAEDTKNTKETFKPTLSQLAGAYF